MVTPKQPVIVGIKTSSLTVNDRVIFRNLTRGGKIIVQPKIAGECILENIPADWINTDEIMVEIQGRFAYGTKITLAKGGGKTLPGTLTADDMPAISL